MAEAGPSSKSSRLRKVDVDVDVVDLENTNIIEPVVLDVDDETEADADLAIVYENITPQQHPFRLIPRPFFLSRTDGSSVNNVRLLKPKECKRIKLNTDDVEVVECKAKAGFADFKFLPNEIIFEIIGRVSNQNDLLHCRLVSKAWNEYSCTHLKNGHRPIEFERGSQIHSFLNLLRHRIGDSRPTFSRFILNLVTLPWRSVELFLSRPEINISRLTITTDGPNAMRKKSKPKFENENHDTVLYIIEKLPRLSHITIDFHHYISDEIGLVTTYAKAIQHIPSVGLTNISFDPTPESMTAFRLLTQVNPLCLTTLKVEFRKALNTTVDDQRTMLDIFYKWLEDHSSTLLNLSINTCVDNVRMPVLPKLLTLSVGVHAIEPHGLETFGVLLPTQFPVLKEVQAGSFLLRKTNMKYDCGIQAFAAEIFPTVETLRLVHIPAESHYDTSFPNIKNLEVGPSVTLLNLRNILSYFMDIQRLSVRFSPVARDWWGALTGGARRPVRQLLAHDRVVVDVEKEKILGGPRRGSCSLAYLSELKSLKFENSHEDVLDALVYLTINKFIPSLDKLYIGTMEPLDYPEELLRILRRYHKSVKVEYN